MSEASLSELVKHLQSYGYVHFDGPDYWDWAERKLGKHAAKIDRLRSRCEEDPRAPGRLREFMDYVAAPAITGVVASQQTDDIAQVTWALTDILVARERILDVGCNVGQTAAWLAKVGGHGRQVVGIDFSQKAIGAAANFAKRLAITNVEFHVGNFDESLPAGPFDAVLDVASLQYARDLVGSFRRARSVLTDNGMLVSVPMLGRAREISEHLAAAREAGLHVRSLSFLYARDLGRNIARPIIVATGQGETTDLDVYRTMDEAKARIAGDRILPVFERA